MSKLLKKNNKNKSVAVFGASGFIGRNLIKLLVKNGWTIKALMRNPHHANFLLPIREVGQIYLQRCNILDYSAVKESVKNVDCVINLVGILSENKSQKFYKIHSDGVKNIAKACLKYNIVNFVHVSALGISEGSEAHYAKSKNKGEELIHSIHKRAVILRPSVVFGPSDNFINRFVKMASISPLMPMVGKGLTKFQPVYVNDLISVIEILISKDIFKGQTFELGGPDIFSLKEIYDLILKSMGIKRLYFPIPFVIAKFLGAACSFFPNPPITIDQVRLLQNDNIAAQNSKGFSKFDINPVSLKEIMESNVKQYSRSKL